MKRALIVSAMENVALQTMRALGEDGVACVLAGVGPGRVPRASRYCADYASVAASEEALALGSPETLDAIVELAQSSGAEAVLPVDVAGGRLAPRLRERLPGLLFLPTPPPEALALNDKWAFSRFVAGLGLPQPGTWRVETLEQALALPLPLILKPLDDAGGRGIVVARDAAALRAALAPGGLRLPCLAQEFLPGDEVSMSFCADEGRLLSWTIHIRRPGGVLEDLDDPRVTELGRKVLAAVRYRGIGNLDMRYPSEGPSRVLLIECNPRVWGSFAYARAIGADMLVPALALARGEKPAPRAAPPVGFCPGLVGTARGLLAGRSSGAAGASYLRTKLADPGPELAKAARIALRRASDRDERRVLVLAAMENLALSVIRTLGAKGCRVTVAGAGEGRLVRLSRHCAEFIPIARDAAELAAAGPEVVAAAARAAARSGSELVVPSDVPGALLAHALEPRLPGVAFFPSPDPAVLRRMDDKWAFYGFLGEHGLPSPKTWRVDGPSPEGLPLPVVIKPLADSGGRGVAVHHTAAERDARVAAGPHPLLAQAFVDGQDVDLSFLADRGRLVAWSVQVREAGAVVYIDDPAVVDIGRRLAAASGYHGLAHIDMRYDGPGREKVVVIECNPRFWGTFQYTLGLGVDFLGLGLEMARGAAPAPIAAAPVGACFGLWGTLRRLARGRPVTAASRVYLCQKLGDPGPELRKGTRALLGIREDGP
ncbi:MAG: ATP-grasp domain-containing protein [Elusimicrobiota bacterium]|nr:ATP-grasp domain-containing protein [Elusimicrobiota bacterium]